MKQEWEVYWDNYRFPKHFMQSDIEPFGNPIRNLIAEKAKFGTVLDVGCASCISFPLFDPEKYVGVDFTLQFLKIAKENHASVVCGYALQLPFANQSFDTVFIKDVLEHLSPDAYKLVIAEMWRIAKIQIILALYGLGKLTKYLQLREPDEHNIGVPPYKGGTYYFNHYCKDDIEDVIGTLQGVAQTEYIEGIRYENSDATGRVLVIVRKTQ